MTPEEIENAFSQNRAGLGGRAGDQVREQKVEHKVKSKPEKVKKFTLFSLKTLKENHVLITTNAFTGKRSVVNKPGIKPLFFINEYVFYDLRLNTTNISARKIKFQDGDEALVDFFYTWKIEENEIGTGQNSKTGAEIFINNVGNNMDGALEAIAELVMSDVSKIASQQKDFKTYRENIYQKNDANNPELISKDTIKYIKEHYGIKLEAIMTKDLIPSKKTADLLSKPTRIQLEYEAKQKEVEAKQSYAMEYGKLEALQAKINNATNIIRAQGEANCDIKQITSLIQALPSLNEKEIAYLYFQNKIAKNGAHVNYTSVNMPQNSGIAVNPISTSPITQANPNQVNQTPINQPTNNSQTQQINPALFGGIFPPNFDPSTFDYQNNNQNGRTR